ncbi:Peptidase S8 propeptide/proteinase inhibitor I9 [Dillenia turbinata]|uniref:Peptidase S8 propeptide/proteinase inhibitor I9 n=1 Tax=Dillenia turbinata TaxID=194707 RepID=A0AAN8ZGH8_9MAGN
MASLTSLFMLSTIVAYVLVFSAGHGDDHRKVYIVYMDRSKGESFDYKSLYLEILGKVLKNISPKESLVYSYVNSFTGFAARLTADESRKLAGNDEKAPARFPGIISVFQSQNFMLDGKRPIQPPIYLSYIASPKFLFD